MNMNTSNLENNIYKFLSDNNSIKGVIHISHGMAEHIGRYTWLINNLNRDGYHVIAIDHRGHGKRIKNNIRGYFADYNGWTLVVNDLIKIINLTKNEYPHLKQYLIGHSMGSWISLGAIQEGVNIDGLILSGSSKVHSHIIRIQRIIILFQMLFFGKKAVGKFLDNIILGQYNKFFEPNRTAKDWISSDNLNVDDYVNDPLCGYPVTIGLWNDLSKGMLTVFKKGRYAQLNKTMPIYIISGTRDPVGENGNGVQRLYDYLNSIYKNVDFDLINNARHEVFSETDKENTYNKLLKFLN